MLRKGWRMPDPSFDRWHALGRLLPAETRERLFDPAFADLPRAWLTTPAGARVPFPIAVIGIWLDCLARGVPWLFVPRRPLTRVGRVCLAGTVVVTIIVVVLVTRIEYGAVYTP
jgi:hypothetical protein